MASSMPDTWSNLLAFLKRSETANRTFSLDDVVDATGLKESSVKAYFSKKLSGLWVSRIDGTSLYRASGIRGIGESEFESVMTQNSLTSFTSFAQWKEQLADLVILGRQRGYAVEEALSELSRGKIALRRTR